MKKAQKIKTLTLAALLSLGSLALSAAGVPKEKNEVGGVRQKIQHAVSLPEELKNPGFNQKVKVSFILNKEGNVEVVAANTANPKLKQSLESQFKQICFTGLAAGTYNVEINFFVY